MEAAASEAAMQEQLWLENPPWRSLQLSTTQMLGYIQDARLSESANPGKVRELSILWRIFDVEPTSFAAWPSIEVVGTKCKAIPLPEAQWLLLATKLVYTWTLEDNITTYHVLQLHNLIYGEGEFASDPRDVGVFRSGAVYTQMDNFERSYMNPLKVREALRKLLAFCNSKFQEMIKETDPEKKLLLAVVLGGRFLSEFVQIHPLNDGNKRTSSLLLLHWLKPVCPFAVRLYSTRKALPTRDDFITALLSNWDNASMNMSTMLGDVLYKACLQVQIWGRELPRKPRTSPRFHRPKTNQGKPSVRQKEEFPWACTRLWQKGYTVLHTALKMEDSGVHFLVDAHATRQDVIEAVQTLFKQKST